jgi:hypothetical protein
MLATILKSPVATQATISIIETFTKIRELSRSVKELSTMQDKTQQKALMQRSGELSPKSWMMICKSVTLKQRLNSTLLC